MIVVLVVAPVSSELAPLSLVGLDLALLLFAGSDLEPVLLEVVVLVAIGIAYHSAAD